MQQNQSSKITLTSRIANIRVAVAAALCRRRRRALFLLGAFVAVLVYTRVDVLNHAH